MYIASVRFAERSFLFLKILATQNVFLFFVLYVLADADARG
jgi:hypothetical protein